MSDMFGGQESAAVEAASGSEKPLTDEERALLQRLLSDPFSIPQQFKTWLVAYLEGSDMLLARSSIQGLGRSPRLGGRLGCPRAAPGRVHLPLRRRGRADGGEALQRAAALAHRVQASLRRDRDDLRGRRRVDHLRRPRPARARPLRSRDGDRSRRLGRQGRGLAPHQAPPLLRADLQRRGRALARRLGRRSRRPSARPTCRRPGLRFAVGGQANLGSGGSAPLHSSTTTSSARTWPERTGTACRSTA